MVSFTAICHYYIEMGDTVVLYHSLLCRSSRALWMFYELKELYGNRIPDIDVLELDPTTFRTCKPAELLKHNPNGKVPTMIHKDIVMWDSCAICLYFLDVFDLDNILAPKDPVFRAKLYKLMFYISGTVDNLTAISSPVQMVLENKKPGEEIEVVAANKKAYQTLVGPLLAKELGHGPWMFGQQFTALDVVFGYNMWCIFDKRNWYEEELDCLKQYHEKLMSEKPLFVKFCKTS